MEGRVNRVPHFDKFVGDEGFDGDAQRDACVDRALQNVSLSTEEWGSVIDFLIGVDSHNGQSARALFRCSIRIIAFRGALMETVIS